MKDAFDIAESHKKKLQGKTILITGGTGSFGSTMMESLLSLSPKEIIIFSRDELKQFEMRNAFPNENLRFVIGDVREFNTLQKATRGVDYIFHAAALKQVPTCEFFPLEAIKTNILGGNNVINAAFDNKVERIVMLSTDKAVYPINAMGMTKALSEKLMLSSAREGTRTNGYTQVCGVRYGNVMYSRGSVIPLFIKQLREGRKLTITHPKMTRFLLPLRESVQLVLHALTAGGNGSIYIKKSPATDMKTLAEAICELFAYPKGYEIVGIRAGEKMHETLIGKEEWLRIKDEGAYYSIPPEAKNLDYDKYFSIGKKTKEEDEGYTSANTKQLDLEQTKKLLLQLPEIKKELQAVKKK